MQKKILFKIKMKPNRNRRKIKKPRSILSLYKPNSNKQKKNIKKPISRKKLTKMNSNSPYKNDIFENVSAFVIHI